jgi:hypothetical protein
MCDVCEMVSYLRLRGGGALRMMLRIVTIIEWYHILR